MLRTTLLSMTAVAALAAPALAESHMEAKDIVATAQEAGDFSTLLSAAEAAGLVETLQGEGPLTVFAPTDAAFDALPEGTLDSLLADTDKLTEILTYHVVEGAVMSSDLSDGQMVATVNGAEAEVSVGDSVMIGDATVVTPDIEASNGVIHVIDSVMMPSM
ncbi:fasciclin domain-containing protein [Limimaricola hongkongensis]|uniref:Beta-Ig-H3/Fasciclin n=1 Tax=Limimaricola hongkongensis DSM 17492 TaxID=1122180 RepID=A0A017HGC2_9RHOB|nr:fasciclin domain-containing protein [Limimaricola hongkongensis]EYD73401.1 Beta-Ig-H3/Fasciclin [Limimaricola hongkongensis DSM 17492]